MSEHCIPHDVLGKASSPTLDRYLTIDPDPYLKRFHHNRLVEPDRLHKGVAAGLPEYIVPDRLSFHRAEKNSSCACSLGQLLAFWNKRRPRDPPPFYGSCGGGKATRAHCAPPPG